MLPGIHFFFSLSTFGFLLHFPKVNTNNINPVMSPKKKRRILSESYHFYSKNSMRCKNGKGNIMLLIRDGIYLKGFKNIPILFLSDSGLFGL